MSRGLRQKEKSRLGEAPRWAPGGLGGRGSGGEAGPAPRLGPWWGGFATYLACVGPPCPPGGGSLDGRAHWGGRRTRPWGNRTL